MRQEVLCEFYPGKLEDSTYSFHQVPMQWDLGAYIVKELSKKLETDRPQECGRRGGTPYWRKVSVIFRSVPEVKKIRSRYTGSRSNREGDLAKSNRKRVEGHYAAGDRSAAPPPPARPAPPRPSRRRIVPRRPAG
ncbi:hypothetical protein EVAR_18327_1 [Eumeta japonica]|uniref:Uncharacterized protein n=1 Tax=Eumeta variegata TaxID=151549 RepID=A0A4C1V9W5_EUMVA|nr:hypothetical protein EVAR_18327_1 [Eumeta japonica]